jgi:hypothetical protein
VVKRRARVRVDWYHHRLVELERVAAGVLERHLHWHRQLLSDGPMPAATAGQRLADDQPERGHARVLHGGLSRDLHAAQLAQDGHVHGPGAHAISLHDNGVEPRVAQVDERGQPAVASRVCLPDHRRCKGCPRLVVPGRRLAANGERRIEAKLLNFHIVVCATTRVQTREIEK